MFNESQEVAWRNLAVLGEENPVSISLHRIRLEDAVELGKQLLGGHDWDAPTIKRSAMDDTWIVSGTIEETKIEFAIFTARTISETPLGPIRASDEVDAEIFRRAEEV
jgi:hypothetical protein